MSLKERINQDFLDAFKNRDSQRKSFLGVLKGEIQNEEGRSGPATDEKVLAILKKMEKSLSMVESEDNKRELGYLEPYLPKLMSRDDISVIVKQLIESGSNNMGLIMKEFNKSYSGKADNKMVSDVTKELLSDLKS